MRTMAILALSLLSPAARAWDGPELWNDPASGGGAPPGQMGSISPGGGGIYGTGGARDYNITCANCHVNDKKQQGQVTLQVALSPQPLSVNGQDAYAPGQRYTVTATLVGEHLGLSGCGPYVSGNVNNFAAAVEDSSGRPAGMLASDSGQSAAACPPAMPKVTGGSTMLYGDCHAVFAMGDGANAGRTRWTFSWTAPAAGSGPLTIYWGAVDGDCMMDSLGDDVKMGMTKLLEATAALPPRPARAPLAFALLVPLAALCLRARRGA